MMVLLLNQLLAIVVIELIWICGQGQLRLLLHPGGHLSTVAQGTLSLGGILLLQVEQLLLVHSWILDLVLSHLLLLDLLLRLI